MGSGKWAVGRARCLWLARGTLAKTQAWHPTQPAVGNGEVGAATGCDAHVLVSVKERTTKGQDSLHATMLVASKPMKINDAAL